MNILCHHVWSKFWRQRTIDACCWRLYQKKIRWCKLTQVSLRSSWNSWRKIETVQPKHLCFVLRILWRILTQPNIAWWSRWEFLSSGKSFKEIVFQLNILNDPDQHTHTSYKPKRAFHKRETQRIYLALFCIFI